MVNRGLKKKIFGFLLHMYIYMYAPDMYMYMHLLVHTYM